jgi:hypothetical protein
LAAYAKAQFALDQPEKDGVSRREHLLAAWRTSGVQPAELAEAPELPDGGSKVWADFQDLHKTRRSGLNGPERIAFADLHSWQIVTRLRLELWEVRAILRLDAEFMASWFEAQKRNSGG